MSINRDKAGRNEVVKKMWEVASKRYGADRAVISKVTKTELMPEKKYQWSLYEHETDTAPVEMVILELNRSESDMIHEEVEDDILNLREQRSRRK